MDVPASSRQTERIRPKMTMAMRAMGEKKAGEQEVV